MAVKCLGNCFSCEHLAAGEVDEVTCPIRVNMIYTKSVDTKVSKILDFLEKGQAKSKKDTKAVEVEVDNVLKIEEDETV